MAKTFLWQGFKKKKSIDNGIEIYDIRLMLIAFFCRLNKPMRFILKKNYSNMDVDNIQCFTFIFHEDMW